MRPRATTGSDVGGAAIVMCSMVAIGSLLAARVSSFGRSVIAEAEVQSVADAVALAGVFGSQPAAQRIAHSNDAVLVEYTVIRESNVLGATVRVVVAVGEHRARSAATDSG